MKATLAIGTVALTVVARDARADWLADALAVRDEIARSDVVVLSAAGDVAWPDGWGGIDEVDAKQAQLFAQVQPILDGSDLAFANIECPLTTIQPKVKKTYPITCDPKRLSYVVDAGFNLISLANNHSLDAGAEGAAETRALMERTSTPERPLFWAGTGDTPEAADEPTRFTVPGKRATVAFFAVSNTGKAACVASMHDDDLERRIAAEAATRDIVIVSVHHGPEYVHVPDADTVARYHRWIDAGADVVLGHHPHVVQGVERYGKGVIFYSLGNFSFGSRTVRHHETGARLYSMLGRVTLRAGSVEAVEVHPLYANNSETWKLGSASLAPVHATPQRLDGDFATAALAEFQDFTAAIPRGAPTRIVVDQGVGRVEPSDEPIAMRNPDAVKIISPPAKEAKPKAKIKKKMKGKLKGKVKAKKGKGKQRSS